MRRRKPAARNRRGRDLADESQKSAARQDLSPRESAGATEAAGYSGSAGAKVRQQIALCIELAEGGG
jgi:hypothetical protein